MKKTVCELFAGVGGFRCGLNHIKTLEDIKKEEKWETVWFSQWEPAEKKTQYAYDCYVYHFGTNLDKNGMDTTNWNIEEVDKNALPDFNLLVGGFPCQDYSVASSLATSKGLIISDLEKTNKDSYSINLIGGNMINESIEKNHDLNNDKIDIKTMIPLAIATSIDALAVGITFAFLRVNIISSTLIIGITTFILSTIGVKLGNKFGNKYEKKAQLTGGTILILIGLKILLEHLNVF